MNRHSPPFKCRPAQQRIESCDLLSIRQVKISQLLDSHYISTLCNPIGKAGTLRHFESSDTPAAVPDVLLVSKASSRSSGPTLNSVPLSPAIEDLHRDGECLFEAPMHPATPDHSHQPVTFPNRPAFGTLDLQYPADFTSCLPFDRGRLSAYAASFSCHWMAAGLLISAVGSQRITHRHYAASPSCGGAKTASGSGNFYKGGRQLC